MDAVGRNESNLLLNRLFSELVGPQINPFRSARAQAFHRYPTGVGLRCDKSANNQAQCPCVESDLDALHTGVFHRNAGPERAGFVFGTLRRTSHRALGANGEGLSVRREARQVFAPRVGARFDRARTVAEAARYGVTLKCEALLWGNERSGPPVCAAQSVFAANAC